MPLDSIKRISTTNPLLFFLTFTVGFTFLVGLPWLQFGVFYPMVFDYRSKYVVQRSRCNCGCWDTWFKGHYEYWPGTYHHVYFNITLQTGLIWATTVLYMLLIYESLRYLITSIWRGKFRGLYSFLFLIGLYSHHYTWWSYFGYFNDDFYHQMFHQTLFSITEVYASWLVLTLATTPSPLSSEDGTVHIRDLDKEISRLSILTAISLAHIAVGSLDQFIEQNLFGIGNVSQQSRNAGFILPDALGVLFPIRDIFLLLPYIFQMVDLPRAKTVVPSDSYGSMLVTSFSLVSNMFFSPHFHKAVLIFFVVVFFGSVL